jgi:hypothetical protein
LKGSEIWTVRKKSNDTARKCAQAEREEALQRSRDGWYLRLGRKRGVRKTEESMGSLRALKRGKDIQICVSEKSLWL